jgi:ABC-2 type transport system permease protein
MHKTWVIAVREYRAQVRTRAFAISLVLLPVLMFGGAALPALLEGRITAEDQKVVVADATGVLFAKLLAQAEKRNEREVMAPDHSRQVEPRYLLEAAPTRTLSDAERFELSQKVRKRKLHAFVEIDATALQTPAVDVHVDDQKADAVPPVRLHLEGAPISGLRRWLSGAVNQAVHGERLRGAGLDPALVARATAPVELDTLGLFTKAPDGTITSGDERSRNASFFFPVVVVMLVFLAIMMSQTMLQNTLEEKQQRIAEVLLGSARPAELMLGKVLGSTGVSLTVIAVYLSGGVWLLMRIGMAGLLRNELLFWLLLFVVLGVLIFGSIFTAVGAACNELKEAQTYMLPVMMVLVLPLMIWFKVLEAPLSGFSTGLSFVPIWTPMLMPLRLAATEAVPLWQPVLAAVITLIAALAAIWAGGRVLRVGLLMQGKPPKLSQLVSWILRG